MSLLQLYCPFLETRYFIGNHSNWLRITRQSLLAPVITYEKDNAVSSLWTFVLSVSSILLSIATIAYFIQSTSSLWKRLQNGHSQEQYRKHILKIFYDWLVNWNMHSMSINHKRRPTINQMRKRVIKLKKLKKL